MNGFDHKQIQNKSPTTVIHKGCTLDLEYESGKVLFRKLLFIHALTRVIFKSYLLLLRQFSMQTFIALLCCFIVACLLLQRYRCMYPNVVLLSLQQQCRFRVVDSKCTDMTMIKDPLLYMGTYMGADFRNIIKFQHKFICPMLFASVCLQKGCTFHSL